jgi:hypothetical protein
MVSSPITMTSAHNFKGKKAAHRDSYIVESAPSSPESSNISSDIDEDDHYFSDVSTGSSSTAASS